MSPKARIEANRRNATRSTGPRTAAGKRRVSRNALRHGLSISIREDPFLSSQIGDLAVILVPGATGKELERARVLAEAALDVVRIRNARASLIRLHAGRLSIESGTRSQQVPKREKLGEDVVAEEGAALSPEQECTARALLEALPQLVRLDRYEMRALSRRRRAFLALIQEFSGVPADFGALLPER